MRAPGPSPSRETALTGVDGLLLFVSDPVCGVRASRGEVPTATLSVLGTGTASVCVLTETGTGIVPLSTPRTVSVSVCMPADLCCAAASATAAASSLAAISSAWALWRARSSSRRAALRASDRYTVCCVMRSICAAMASASACACACCDLNSSSCAATDSAFAACRAVNATLVSSATASAFIDRIKAP